MSLTKEDLLAIAQVLDKKLDTRLNPMENGIGEIRVHIGKLEDGVKKVEVRLGNVEEKVGKMEVRLGNVEEKVEKMEVRFGNVEEKIGKVENRLQKIEVGLENDIVPRLNTIENCYTTTYNRYSTYADKMETCFSDVELLKTIVSEHSEKLRKIS